MVQLGLAMIPWWAKAAWGFTSGTTRGTWGSRRKALELSITRAPAAAATGAHCLDTEPPAEANTRSTPAKASAPTAWMGQERPFQVRD